MREPSKHLVKVMNSGALIHVTWKTPSISWFTSISMGQYEDSLMSLKWWIDFVFISLPRAWIPAMSAKLPPQREQQRGSRRECHLEEMKMLPDQEWRWRGTLTSVTFTMCEIALISGKTSVQKSWHLDAYVLTGFPTNEPGAHYSPHPQVFLFYSFSFFYVVAFKSWKSR